MAGLDNSWPEGGRGDRAFLLRCWIEDDFENGWEPGRSPTWRFSLAHIGREQGKKGFRCLEELFDYLHGQLEMA